MDVHGALEVIDEMIQDTIKAANVMREPDPVAYESLNAGTGIGIRLQVLKDAHSAIVKAAIEELETKAEAATMEKS